MSHIIISGRGGGVIYNVYMQLVKHENYTVLVNTIRPKSIVPLIYLTRHNCFNPCPVEWLASIFNLFEAEKR